MAELPEVEIPPLLKAVPAGAGRVLCVGTGLAETLKRIGPPGREVWEADLSLRQFDGLELGGFDCAVFDDNLDQAADPHATLGRVRELLIERGVVTALVSNAQHYSVMAPLFSNDLEYKAGGLLNDKKRRLFTQSGFYKLMLDCDLMPHLLHSVVLPCPEALLEAAKPLARHFRLDPGQLNFKLSSYRYVIGGIGYAPAPADDEPMSFVVCCNDHGQLDNNLAVSPCFLSGRHELLVVEDAKSAGEAIAYGLSRARHPLVAVVHQDIYLPEGFPARLQQQWRAAEARFGRLGVAGTVGVSVQAAKEQRTGRIINAMDQIDPGYALPAPAVSLDEVVLVFPRDTDIQFDPSLGWHCYGTDAVFQALQAGRAAAILDAPTLHNTRFAGLGADFVASADVLAEKWKARRPFHTTCVRVAADGGLSGWGF